MTKNVLAIREYCFRQAALLLACEDAETRSKGLALLFTVLFDARFQ